MKNKICKCGHDYEDHYIEMPEFPKYLECAMQFCTCKKFEPQSVPESKENHSHPECKLKKLKANVPDLEFCTSEVSDSSIHHEIDKLAGEELL